MTRKPRKRRQQATKKAEKGRSEKSPLPTVGKGITQVKGAALFDRPPLHFSTALYNSHADLTSAPFHVHSARQCLSNKRRRGTVLELPTSIAPLASSSVVSPTAPRQIRPHVPVNPGRERCPEPPPQDARSGSCDNAARCASNSSIYCQPRAIR